MITKAHPIPPPAFFQTCATLIATLAVSLFLQVHYVERISNGTGRHARLGLLMALLLAGVVFIGEGAALSALVHGPTRLREVLVYLALTTEGLLLISSATELAFTALRERNRTWAQPALIVIATGFATSCSPSPCRLNSCERIAPEVYSEDLANLG